MFPYPTPGLVDADITNKNPNGRILCFRIYKVDLDQEYDFIDVGAIEMAAPGAMKDYFKSLTDALFEHDVSLVSNLASVGADIKQNLELIQPADDTKQDALAEAPAQPHTPILSLVRLDSNKFLICVVVILVVVNLIFLFCLVQTFSQINAITSTVQMMKKAQENARMEL